MLSRNSSGLFLRLYEALLCIYIVVAPINNALNDRGIYAMVGYAAMLLLAVGTPCALLGQAFGAQKKMGGIYTAIYLVGAFASAGTLMQLIQYHGATQILMFAQFISISRRVNLKKIFMAFYVSAIISAMFSVTLGWVSSSVTRTAADVDGSIAPAVLAIVMFAQEDFERTRSYNALKTAALYCGIIVAFFGMSRSRLALIAVMVLLKIVLSLRSSATSGKVKQSMLLLLPLGLIAIVVALEMDVTQQLLSEIEGRFESGFEDQVRDAEAEAGWRMFQENWLIGRGWKKLLYKLPIGYRIHNNHNMYVSILARGGIILGITMGISFFRLIKRALEKKNTLVFIMLGLFFALGYGNAGAFNYTICSMMIPVAILLDQEKVTPEQEEVLVQEEGTNENNLYS